MTAEPFTDASAADQDIILRVEDLHVSFHLGRRTIRAVEGVSFSLRKGRCLAIVGESGSGKSVTARSLVGLTGHGAFISHRTLTIAGRDARRYRERDWRRVRGREIALVLQDAMTALDPLRTVGREVAEPIVAHRLLPRRAVTKRVTELLSDVGIPDARDRIGQYPHELSGGLRQRALIASALAASPAIIIADEPTTALDVTVQRQVLDLLATLKESGVTILLISHDLGVVASIADDILVMKSGRVVESGSVDSVLTYPKHPYTAELIAAVPALDDGGSAVRPAAAGSAHFAVSVNGIRKTYRSSRHSLRAAVDRVSFDVRVGESLGIVGESGSGKSTVARALLGLLELDEGTVRVFGQAWSELKAAEARTLRRRIQIIHQDTASSFDPRQTVESALYEALGQAGIERSQRRLRAITLLEDVGLGDDHLHRRPSQLSGGQRQRVAIARALAVRPEILVCDEPVSALDVTIQAQVLDLLDHLRRIHHLTLVFVSHDLAVVARVADRVIVMKDGRIVEEGLVRSVFDHPAHDYTRRLIESAPRIPERLDADKEPSYA